MKQKAKQTAIITGSSRGIGKETAIILAKRPTKTEIHLKCTAVIFESTWGRVR